MSYEEKYLIGGCDNNAVCPNMNTRECPTCGKKMCEDCFKSHKHSNRFDALLNLPDVMRNQGFGTKEFSALGALGTEKPGPPGLIEHMKQYAVQVNFRDILNDPNKDNYENVLVDSQYDSTIVRLPTGLRTLTLGQNFNQPLVLPAGLQTLTLGYNFDEPLVLPTGLRTLKLGSRFNQPLVLPTGLYTLISDGRFNQPLVLPTGLKKLTLGDQFNQPLVLPTGLEDLKLGSDFNQKLVLPAELRTLTLGQNFNQPLVLPLPRRLSRLTLSDAYNFDLGNFPERLVNRYTPKPKSKKLSFISTKTNSV